MIRDIELRIIADRNKKIINIKKDEKKKTQKLSTKTKKNNS